MELRYLKSFVVLAQELHFGRAARRLHIVQSALSKQMKLLEDEVGCRLLNRNRRGVALSDAGRLFLSEAEQAINHAERAVEVARRAGTGLLGRVRIGYSASAVHSGVLADFLTRIEQQFPEVDVVLERVEPWQQTERLRAHEIDFAIGPRPLEKAQGGLYVRRLAILGICVALSSRHALAGREELHRDDLKDEDFIEFADSEAEGYAVVSRLLGIVPRRLLTRPDPLAVIALVQAGRGVCALPSVMRLPDFPQVIYKSLRGSTSLEVVVISLQSHSSSSLLYHLEKLICQSDIHTGAHGGILVDLRER
ncbi:Cat operon transcriptional regulator [Serratia ficaria]|uniref:LysR family transcriptional regulator n=1 Tax=Serratia ficaria TaxID=61651 RepID=UPI002183B9C8|nr:LysR substrate-binding domain-containing protein [Serratia ficaria]CAI2526499.1 Cat operon transcriptional regulator [Serratia ficaria]